jgi:hypothetical protein
MKKLHITERLDEGWHLSFEKPDFQSDESIKIDEETAKMLLSLRHITNFLENYEQTVFPPLERLRVRQEALKLKELI